MKKLIFAATLLCTTNAFAVGQAFLDGQAAGASVLGRDAGSVTATNTTALQNINTANPDPAAISTLQGNFAASNAGNAGLGSFGSQKLSDCASYVPNPATPAKNEECAAVNELAKNPVGHAVAVTGVNKSDSMFTKQNNMVNQGLSGPAPALAVGSGTPGGNVTGAGACLQTTSSTPPVYTKQTCTRSAVPTPQTCQIAMAPTITETKFCDIAGTAKITSSDPDGVMSQFGLATGQPFYSITFGCQTIASGKAVISPYFMLPNGTFVGYGTWSLGGGISIGWHAATVVFVPGTSTTPIGWWSGINYDGTPLVYTTAWYDGPSNTIRVQTSGRGGAPITCDSGYTYAKHIVNYTTYIYARIGTSTAFGLQTFPASETYQYCTSATDTASQITNSVTPVVTNVCTGNFVMSGVHYVVASKKYYVACKGKNNNMQPITTPTIGKGTICPSGWTLGINGICESGTSRMVAFDATPTGTCDADHTYTIIGDKGFCYPNKTRLNLYGQSSPNYTGAAGIHQVLNENINDNCAQFQASTATPSASPATSVAGTLVCPTGKTLSGTNCI